MKFDVSVSKNIAVFHAKTKTKKQSIFKLSMENANQYVCKQIKEKIIKWTNIFNIFIPLFIQNDSLINEKVFICLKIYNIHEMF